MLIPGRSPVLPARARGRPVGGHGMIRRSIEIAAGAEILFDLTQDSTRRLDWDPFLREARLLGGAEGPGVGARAWCVGRSGIGMETR